MSGRQGDERDAPSTAAVDPDEEKRRLLDDAHAHGVDEAEALDLAERLSAIEPLADSYRDVDRRVATGLTIDEAEAILLDDLPEAPDDDPT